MLKYATSFSDVVLLTTIAAAGGKAESTLVISFFIIAASTFLRFSNKLIFSTTALCIAGYLGLVFQTTQYWDLVGEQGFPYLEVFRTVGGLAVMGLIGWQLCRTCRFGVEKMVEFERQGGDDE